jgi:16S rRNA processing protein RimM
MASRLVPIAEIARPHGVKGELRLKVYNEDTELIGKGRRVTLLRPATAKTPQGEPLQKTLTSVRKTEGGLLVRLDGIDDRDVAEGLRGVEICVARDELPDLPDGEFYAFDVEGARAELVSGDVIGLVTELRTYPTCSVLAVKLDVGREIEVPLVDDYVAEVDTEAHVVKLHHIDEL